MDYCTMHMSHQFEMPLEEYVYKRYTNFAQMTSAKVGQKKIEIMQWPFNQTAM